MEKLKTRWDIVKNWQYFFPIFGALLVMLTAYIISIRLIPLFGFTNSAMEWSMVSTMGIILYFLLVRFFLWCFKKLSNKWVVTYRWEMIAIFIVFAITGSVSGKLAGPLTELIGLEKGVVNGWLYWTARILLIFPIYQVLLIFVGWLFGQFKFFWDFEKKMLRRMGLGFLIP